MTSTGILPEKARTDRVERLLASRRLNAILKQLSTRFPPQEECGDNAVGNSTLLDTLVSCVLFPLIPLIAVILRVIYELKILLIVLKYCSVVVYIYCDFNFCIFYCH